VQDCYVRDKYVVPAKDTNLNSKSAGSRKMKCGTIPFVCDRAMNPSMAEMSGERLT
jgi:hypothetical protein